MATWLRLIWIVCLGLPTAGLAARGPASQPAAPTPVIPEESDTPDEPRLPARTRPDPIEIGEFVRGANLETDSEVQAFLRRARESLAEKRYREAITVLQGMIDRSGTALTTIDGQVYRPTRIVATEMLAAAPAEALATYRLWADGEARGLVADPDKSIDAEALDQVVRRFFLSNIGEQAAFRLGCLAMDREDYAQARRLFNLILQTPRDPGVDRGQVFIRLAFACARLDDRPGLAAARAKLAAMRKTQISPVALAAVEAATRAGATPVQTPTAGWPMAFGSPQRLGVMSDLPAALRSSTEKLWAAQWEQVFPIDRLEPDPEAAGTATRPAGPVGARRPAVPAANRQPVLSAANLQALRAAKRHLLLGFWAQNQTSPSCQLVSTGDRVFFKSLDALLCCDLNTGRRVWEVREASNPATQPGETTRAARFGLAPLAQNIQESQILFVDRIGRSLSLIDDQVYHIEEHPRFSGNVAQSPPGMPVGNALSAHDARTGQRLWRVGRNVDPKKPLGAVQFLAQPTPCQGRLLVPLEENGELLLVALNPSDGTLVWRTFLCTYASLYPMHTRPVGVWVAGTEVLVAPGRGAIFALDGSDGSLQWAARYEPNQPRVDSELTLWRLSRLAAEGCQEDYITIHGDQVIVVPSDADSVLVFDRQTGQPRFGLPVKVPRYCLGFYEGGLFIVGAEGLQRLDLATGKIAWKCPLPEVGGRGVLAGDNVYLPSGSRVLRIDAATGKVAGELQVRMPDDQPVGNLLLAGQQILVGGLDRVVALRHSGAMLEELDKRIAAGPDASACLVRARLHRDAGRLRQATDDLRKAVTLLEATDGRQAEARSELLAALLELARTQADAPAMLEEATTLVQSPADRVAVAVARARWLRGQGKPLESVKAWRNAGDLSGGELLRHPEDADLRVAGKIMAAAALRELLAEQTGAARKELLAQADENLRAAMADGSPRAVLAAIRSFGGAGAVAAARQAAQRLRAAGDMELAELLLAELAGSFDATTAAAGLAALADLHETHGWRRQARREWEELARRFATTTVSSFGDPGTGAELAGRRLTALPDAGDQRLAGLADPPWRVAWSVPLNPGDGMELLRPQAESASQFLTDHLLLFTHRDWALRCVSARDGRAVWRLPLPRSGNSSTLLRASSFHGQRNLLRHDGHIGLIRSETSLMAYSLLTGKQLWEQKDTFIPRVRSRRGAVDFANNGLGEIDVASDAGAVAVKSAHHRVRVLDLGTGDTRWERTYRGLTVQRVTVRKGCVLISLTNPVSWHGEDMPPPTIIQVCDALTGRVISTQDWAARGYWHGGLTWTDWGFICPWSPHDSEKVKIVACELPSGKTRWSTDWRPDGAETDAPAYLKLLRDGTGKELLVGCGNSGAAAIEVETGRPRWWIGTDKVAQFQTPMGLGLGSGSRVAFVTIERRDDAGWTEMVLRLVSLENGTVERKVGLGKGSNSGGTCLPQPLGDVRNWLPVGCVNLAADGTFSDSWTLAAYPIGGDAKAGPQPLPLGGDKNKIAMIYDLAVRSPDCLLVLSSDGLRCVIGAPKGKPK